MGRSVLIAATNHDAILDVAIWRRFEEVFVFPPPTVAQLPQLLALKLRGVRREFEIEDVDISTLFKGASHADVERVLRRAIKDMVLAGQEFLTLRHLQAAARREGCREPRYRKSDLPDPAPRSAAEPSQHLVRPGGPDRLHLQQGLPRRGPQPSEVERDPGNEDGHGDEDSGRRHAGGRDRGSGW
ncbi:MAG: hypothetical protein DIJKHBIC_01269 [Thermoanaerobaculia bacterium]|nr:hypothetical protein [Thermoanaerobaculia bacterium]